MHWIDRILIPSWDRGILSALTDDYKIKHSPRLVMPNSEDIEIIAAG